MNLESRIRYTIFGLCIAGLFASVGISACDYLDPSPDATITEPDVTDDECGDITTLTYGSQIYRCECASCHGPDGVPLADDITDIRGFESSTDFKISLNIGPSSMPAYPQLTNDQRDALFDFVSDSLGM